MKKIFNFKKAQQEKIDENNNIDFSQPVSNPSPVPEIEGTKTKKEYPTLFKPWKQKQGNKWKVLGYYINILEVDPSSDEGKLLSELGYKYNRDTFSKPIKTIEDIDKYKRELISVSEKTLCSFSNKWIEESQEAFPSGKITDTVPEENKEQKTKNDEIKIKNILTSKNIDELKKKEISENFIREKLKELAETTDEAAKNEFIIRFLTVNKEFHNYSFVNTILMMLQKADVSPFVAGAKQWEDQNGKYKRRIKEGESPLQIFAPEQNLIYVAAAKSISNKLSNYIKETGSSKFSGDSEYLANKIGIDNFYAKHFLGYSLFMGGNDLNKTIHWIEEQIKRFSRYKTIYYGTKTHSGGQPLFKLVDVFDISQTEPTGEDSFQEPERDFWQSSHNQPDSKAQAITRAAVKFAKGAKYKVGGKWETGINVDLVAKTGRSGGWSAGAAIAIDEMSSGWRQLSTVIHEIAHSLLHFGDDRSSFTSQQKEIEAEATAFIVLNFFDFTETRFAANYLALHKATSSEIDVLERYNKVDFAAKNIIKGIQDNLENEVSANWFIHNMIKKYANVDIDSLSNII